MAFAAICTPKGYESLAQGLPCVLCFSATHPEGAPESNWPVPRTISTREGIRGQTYAAICTPKGYENLAQGLPWVWGFSPTRPEGAPESNFVGGKNTRAGVSRYTVYARPTSLQPMNVAP
jgi:hypothetical protein